LLGRKEQFGLGLLSDYKVVVELAEVCLVQDFHSASWPLRSTKENQNTMGTTLISAVEVLDSFCQGDAFHDSVISEVIIIKKTSGELVLNILTKMRCGLNSRTDCRGFCNYFRF
jgi:hypothetical protein